MKSQKNALLIVLGLLIGYSGSYAQNHENNQPDNYFKISGQYRIRSEYRKGYKVLAADTSKAAFFIGQRARLIFDYKKDKISFYSSIQDSRTWGDEEQRKDIGELQVNELWLEMALHEGFSIKMGRQELAYDDHRILGNADWGNLTISHDALLVKYINKAKNFNWHIGGAYNQSGEPVFGTSYALKNYKYLGFSWLKKELSNIHSSISILAVFNGVNPTDSLHQHVQTSITTGPLFNYKNKEWKASLGAYYQGGNAENHQSLGACMINGYGEYRKNKISGGLGIDVLSGNSDNTPANESRNFSTLYATNHKFYGYMDYFLTIPSDTKERGLTDVYLRVGIMPEKIFTTTIDVHSFSLAHPNNKGTQKIGKHLGTELDLIFDYKPSPFIAMQAGYSMMFATKNMELIKGGNANNYNGWAFIMLKVSPLFFSHESAQ